MAGSAVGASAGLAFRLASICARSGKGTGMLMLMSPAGSSRSVRTSFTGVAATGTLTGLASRSEGAGHSGVVRITSVATVTGSDTAGGITGGSSVHAVFSGESGTSGLLLATRAASPRGGDARPASGSNGDVCRATETSSVDGCPDDVATLVRVELTSLPASGTLIAKMIWPADRCSGVVSLPVGGRFAAGLTVAAEGGGSVPSSTGRGP
jgi:hypothetical protein